MKTLKNTVFGFVFASLFISFSALAQDAAGRAELTLWPDFGGAGLLEMDIRQENGKILGRTFFGNGLVNLDVHVAGKYRGFAGGSAATDLTCDASKCSGIINGNSAQFSTKVKETHGGREVETTG